MAKLYKCYQTLLLLLLNAIITVFTVLVSGSSCIAQSQTALVCSLCASQASAWRMSSRRQASGCACCASTRAAALTASAGRCCSGRCARCSSSRASASRRGRSRTRASSSSTRSPATSTRSTPPSCATRRLGREQ